MGNRMVIGRLAALAAMFLTIAQAETMQIRGETTARTARVFGYDVVHRYAHDPEAFTQGLIYRDGVLFESTGLNGRSSLRKVRLETGEVLQQQDVDKK